MKKYRFILALIVLSGSLAFGQDLAFNSTKIVAGPGIDWEQQTLDLGELERGKPAISYFSFKNNGTEAVIIEKVKTSCGCTASDYPKEPIAPGKTARIKVSYNAKNPGAFAKTITVYSNAVESMSVLRIKGVVN